MVNRFINANYLEYIPILNKHIVKKDINIGNELIKENDTVEMENNDITYFEVIFKFPVFFENFALIL